ncbi:tetratricopeptide repeat protein [Sulfurihydrogenibium azorense]|uniref:tetratricopeptide repeat protein n=1 Tax=Sulfurihydrogenibium azorense TaxID=309806 RepID=UPI0024091CE5|nr:tetratricopeptide repeat protein [Sulfurihydrogenibium azorense]MDM7273016.1 tetratricopeptide repeat protein [Sulfurihydrogenibium azorense]
MRKSFIAILLGFFILSCSIPKIVVYDDPLSASEHNDLGVIYEKKGKFDLAEKEYKKAISNDKNWYLPYFNLGNLYYKMGQKEKAVEYYLKSLEKERNPDTLNNLAYVLYELGRYEEAKKYIEEALSIKKDPNYEDTYKKILEKLNH